MSELSVGQLKGLPVNSNKITVPSGNTLYAPGHVLQVVQAIKTDTSSIASSQAWSDIAGLSATITPKSASSKILILADVHVGGEQYVNIYTRTLRDSIVIGSGVTSGGQVVGNAMARIMDIYTMMDLPHNILDSPATTSAITYKIQVASNVINTFYINRSSNDAGWNALRSSSTITLMEIAA